MPQVKTITNNGLTIVENYNKLCNLITYAKTVDDVRALVGKVREFISVYKKADKTLVNQAYEKFQAKLREMIEENEFVHNRMFEKVTETRNWAYDFAGEKDDSQAVQSTALQLMARLPKTKTTANENGISAIITSAINSGAIGSKAVLELLKYPAYADMVSERFRQKAFEGSKSPAELAFERAKETHVKQAEQALASVYLQGFHLRNIEKQAIAFKKPSAWTSSEDNG